MKDKVTIEIDTEEGNTEQTVIISWREVPGGKRGRPVEWYYECKGWEGTALEVAMAGIVPIEEDIKAILKEEICRVIERLRQ